MIILRAVVLVQAALLSADAYQDDRMEGKAL